MGASVWLSNVDDMETSLLATSPQFQRFFYDSPVGMVIISVDGGRYADVNHSFAHMLGYKREDLIGRPFEVMGLSDSDTRQTVLNALINIRKLGDIPLQMVARDGQTRTCIASAQLEYIDDIPFFFLIVQDLTEQERTLEELRLSEARFQLLLRSIPLPLLVIDKETNHILDINPAACEMYGYTPTEFTNLSLIDITPAEDWAEFLRATKSDTPGAPSVICRQLLKSGEIIEVEVSSDTVMLDGRALNLSIIRDVTEQRAFEAALRASQERLRIVADVTTDTIRIRDMATDLTTWSPSLKTKFGYKGDETLDYHWWSARLHPDDRANIETSLETAIRTGEDHWSSEYRFLRADGEYANVLDRGRIIRDEIGRPTRFLGAMVDITEQLQVAEAASQAALEERQRLARDLHESVTQSLYSLSLMAEAVRRHSMDNAEPLSTEYISRLGELSRQALRQLRLLVYELRPSQLEQVGLAAALRHRLEAVEQRAGVKFQLQVELAANISTNQKGDIFRLAQDMLNLSLKHAGATSVSVRLWEEERRLLLEISDDGRRLDAPQSRDDLTAIYKQVDTLGGEMIISHGDKGGMTLRARIPTDSTGVSKAFESFTLMRYNQ